MPTASNSAEKAYDEICLEKLDTVLERTDNNHCLQTPLNRGRDHPEIKGRNHLGTKGRLHRNQQIEEEYANQEAPEAH